MLDKTCEIAERRSDEDVVFNHNVASAMVNFGKIDPSSLGKYQVLQVERVSQILQKTAIKYQ